MISDKKKILLITVRADHGGGPKHIFLLLKNLSKYFEFFMACPKDEPYFNIFAKIIGYDRIFEIPHRKFRISSFNKLKQLIREKDINIIHSHGKGGGIYGRFLSRSTGIQCIHTFHGIHIGEYNFVKKFLYLTLEKYLSHFTHKFISVSDSERDNVIALKITKDSKISLIPNGVEITDRKLNADILSKDRLIITTITRFDFAKNSELIIPIFNQVKLMGMLNKFELQIIGEGPSLIEVRNLAEENGLSGNLKFVGNINSPAEYLFNSFCYISTSRWEGLPLGVLEAMSIGLPVIATNVIGNYDLVEHLTNGFLFNIDRPEEAARYIIQLANNTKTWTKFSENARHKIMTNYPDRKMAKKTMELYLSLN
ncbi:MAG TPA: glycosyltransferase [Ignavibacteriaceae bacterium]|nr:glycosyltransferase [Ignavibacteriaceae bacterium]